MHSMAIPVLSIFGNTILFALFFIFTGYAIFRKTFPNASGYPLSFRLGLGYFFGMYLFIACYRVIAYITGTAIVSLWISVAIQIFFFAYELRKSRKTLAKAFSLSTVWVLIVLGVFFSVSTITWWLFPVSQQVPDLGAHVGSVHTGRYANIATYIMEHNWIPRFNQNYLQSLLASIHLLMGPVSQ